MSFRQLASAAFFSVLAWGQESPYAFDNPVIVMTKNGAGGTGEGVVRGPKGSITVTDTGWKVTASDDVNGIWRLTITLDALPAPSKQPRALKVTSAGNDYPLKYWLTDAEPASPAIKWTALSDGVIDRGQCLQISGAVTGAFPATGIKLVGGRVKEERTGEIVSSKLTLSRLKKKAAGESGEKIPERSAQSFQVCGDRWPLGEFTVTLILASLQEAAPQTMTFSYRTRDEVNSALTQGQTPSAYTLQNPVAVLTPVAEAAASESKIFFGELIVAGPDQEASFFDAGEPAMAGVQALAATFDKTTSGHLWKVNLKFAKVDKDAVQRRLLTIIPQNGEATRLEYWIVNNAVTIGLTASPSADQATLKATDCLPIVIAADRVPITGVRLAGGSIIESKIGNTLGADQLRLVSANGSFDLLPRTSRRFQVCPADHWPAGSLSGKLRFSSDQKYLSDDLSIAFFTRRHQGWGLVLLVAGTILCLILRFWGDAQVLRAQAMVPVVELREQYESLKTRLSPIEQNLPNVKNDVDKQLESLGDQALQPHLPSNITGGIQGLSDLPAYLKARTDRLAALELLVRGGLLIQQRLPAPSPTKMSAAFTALDELCMEPLELDVLRTKIQGVLDQLATPDNAEALTRGDIVEPVTFRTLELTVRRWLFARLLIGVILIVLTGAVALILNQKPFGTFFDLALCLLWGFGLTSVAGVITRDQVLSSVGLPVPQKS